MEKKILENHVIKPSLTLIVNDTEHRLMPVESEVSLDQKIRNIENLIKFNHGFGRTESEKDSLYDEAKSMWQSLAQELRDVAFTFYLNQEQHTYLLSLLNNELEYDVNTVFFAMELVKLLGEWSKSSQTDSDVNGYLADSTETTYMYHILAKHKVKGMNKETQLFSEILLKIADISKIVSYYDTHAKSLSKEVQEWVASFDEPVGSTLGSEFPQPQF